MKYVKYDLNKVKQAAKFLDQTTPDWYMRINVRRLDIESTTSCILAQLFNSSYYGVMQLGIEARPKGAFGYKVFTDGAAEKITKKWIKQINKRLKLDTDHYEGGVG